MLKGTKNAPYITCHEKEKYPQPVKINIKQICFRDTSQVRVTLVLV